MNVLVLASWYPNALDPFSGDFIKRQAEAVSVFQPLKIVYVGKLSKNLSINNKSNEDVYPNLSESLFYYPGSESINFLTKSRSFFSYFKKHLQFIGQLHKNRDLPDLIHVQVAWKAGLIAIYLKWKYGIPYVLSEHWSGYYPQAQDSLFKKSLLERFLIRRILGNANLLITVSEALGKQIQQKWRRIPFQHIPNVVNTRFFYPEKNKPRERFRFIHISTLKHPKNPEGILRAFSLLGNRRGDAELILIGPLNPGLVRMIQEMDGGRKTVRCTGEISYQSVALELRNASALVLFSHYENMPCVILESLCCGVPVIASRVGGIPEVVNESNGILVTAGDEKALQEAMVNLLSNENFYNRESISQRAAAQFSYEVVGKEIIKTYASVLDKR